MTTTALAGRGTLASFVRGFTFAKKKDADLGALLLARPTNPRYRWSGEYPPGLDGLEIINLKDVWQEAWTHKRWPFLWSLFVYPFHEKLSLLRLFETPEDATRLWDELAQRQPMIGIAGAGAEEKMKFPTYETLLPWCATMCCSARNLQATPRATSRNSRMLCGRASFT